MPSDRSILVVGAGPAGAASAALLAQAGFAVTLCEQKSFPRPKVCGEFVAPQSRPTLDRLGLLPAIDALSGPPITRMEAHPSSGQSLAARLPPDATGHFPHAIPRDLLDLALLNAARAAGTIIRQPCHITSITGNPSAGFTATTPDGPLHARAIILAHGLAQKGSLDPADPTPDPRKKYMCFKAHFSHCRLADDTIAIGGAPGVYIGLVRSGAADSPALFSLAFVTRIDRSAGNPPDAQLAAILRQNAGFARMLAPAARATPWLASGPLDPGVRTIYRAGRFYVGNAAGEVHALVGEGITLALRAAALLADTLTHHGLEDPDAAGRAYAAAWRKEFAPRYRAANVFANIIMRPPLAAAAAHMLAAHPALLDYCIVRSGKWHAA